MINNIKTIGIVGGGQLGRMMIPYIKKLGLNVVVLDPSDDCPCSSICDTLIKSSFTDSTGYKALAALSDVITYEFEHIEVSLLKELENNGVTVYPSVDSLAIIQDKFTQKRALVEAGIAVPEFYSIKNLAELKEFYSKRKVPLMLKSRKGGYDGKGNAVIFAENNIELAFKALSSGGDDDLMVEQLLDFLKEVSVIATRGVDGTCVVYPVVQNLHKDSILDVTSVPADISGDIAKKVESCAKAVMECFKGIGTFCVELFITKDGNVLVNEVAPRVHNSGHFSIEACHTSQFENHIRAIIGLKPDASTLLYPYAAMKNIIGAKDGVASYTGLDVALNIPLTHLHIYGKHEVKKGRKMGHVTIVGDKLEVEKKLATLDIKA